MLSPNHSVGISGPAGTQIDGGNDVSRLHVEIELLHPHRTLAPLSTLCPPDVILCLSKARKYPNTHKKLPWLYRSEYSGVRSPGPTSAASRGRRLQRYHFHKTSLRLNAFCAGALRSHPPTGCTVPVLGRASLGANGQRPSWRFSQGNSDKLFRESPPPAQPRKVRNK